MGRKKTEEFWNIAGNNNCTYLQYYERLLNLAIGRVEWLNVPDGIDTRFLELCLVGEGRALLFYDEVLEKFLGLQFAYGGGFDVYRNPLNRRAFAINGSHWELNENDSVIVFNNLTRTNSYIDIVQFAKRLYNLDRIIDVNSNAQKTPVLIACDEHEVLGLENTYAKWEGNYPVIKGTKDLKPDTLRAMSTGAPYVCDRLYALKTQYWNEALTYLGITNVSINKKERLVTDEVERNLGGVMANRYSYLAARQQACDKFNKMFGTKMSVRWRITSEEEGEPNE